MSRLSTALRWDMTLQARHGFYAVYLVITTIYVVVLRQLPPTSLPSVLTIMIYYDPAFLGFFFIGGIVLLEKSERTLDGLVVTPLRIGEYIAAKTISLTLLALVPSMLLAWLSGTATVAYGLLIIGVTLTSILFVLLGFVAVARCSTLNQYLLSAVVYFTLLNLPLVSFLGLFDTPLFYLFPAHASLLLIGGAFAPVASWQLLYGALYLVLWSLIAYRLSRRAFYRHIVLNV